MKMKKKRSGRRRLSRGEPTASSVVAMPAGYHNVPLVSAFHPLQTLAAALSCSGAQRSLLHRYSLVRVRAAETLHQCVRRD